jgi:hypothetical protein
MKTTYLAQLDYLTGAVCVRDRMVNVMMDSTRLRPAQITGTPKSANPDCNAVHRIETGGAGDK